MGSAKGEKLRFCIDRGGTFTDVYAEIPGHSDGRVLKLLSVDPSNYDDAPIEGIRRILEELGTSLVPNLRPLRNEPSNLYEEAIEVDERVELALEEEKGDEEKCGSFVKGFLGLLEKGISCLAVVLMHSYTYPYHEMAVEKLAVSLGFRHVSLSSALTPMVRVVPRGLTASVDAYLTPVVKEYLSGFISRFDEGIAKLNVLFMQSDGGLAPESRFSGHNAVLSGPAGGVVGYSQTLFGLETEKPLIGFDMGGYINRSPQLDINTVAAGGGSKLKFVFGAFRVGPESVGAHPGPVCYRKGGELAVTDANLILGYVVPDYFPAIFGPKEDQPLDVKATRKEFEKLAEQINSYRKSQDSSAKDMTVEEIALGFVNVSNETMCRPIRQLTEMKGHETRNHALACFGGAGPQHACAIARSLGMMEVLIHRFCGILSAYGMGLANVVEEAQVPYAAVYGSESVVEASRREAILLNQVKQKLQEQGFGEENIKTETYLNLRYEVTDTAIMNRNILVCDVRVRGIGVANILKPQTLEPVSGSPKIEGHYKVFFGNGWHDTPLFKLENLGCGHVMPGPAIIMNGSSTVIVEPKYGTNIAADFYLTNIKERLDFSCALFGPDGGLVANAPHVPVHLGAMSSTVRWQLKYWGVNLNEGDVLVTNHPCAGGHHAEIGGVTPGSMPPFSKSIWEEGAAIKAFKLVEKGIFQEEGIIKLLKFTGADEYSQKIPGTRRLQDNLSDLRAQVAANQRGITLIKELIEQYGLETVQSYMTYVQLNAEEAVREMLKSVAARISAESTELGKRNSAMIEEEDCMDDGSFIHLKLTIDSNKGEADFDFSGTSPEVYGNWNAPEAVTAAAVIYCLRCLVDVDIPLNQGCLVPVKIHVPTGSLLSPSDKAAVVGGNVLTSQRVTDVALIAFQACACSQGCMNNLTFGDNTFGYYETIGGGSGAGPTWDGTSGVQCHMTNTRMTDPEIFEQRRPVVVSILSERRVHAPRGLKGGANGARGANYLITKDKRRIYLGGKNTVEVQAGEILKILTPGGGGWGSPPPPPPSL
ncbi:5-oxoprolinase [Hibiscus syriacus]|uniref:5-oxoprolinase n=1 Tax=Hibiscus syriacus TaxID=106335 RepID=A0A6A2XC05_HIBSY|nr:5-oxoprolinase [Hibiscus syriacus]